ncbi:MAG: hypothetical protein ACLVI6_06750 [Bifidobacterium bifidum]
MTLAIGGLPIIVRWRASWLWCEPCEGMERGKPTVGTASHSETVWKAADELTNQQINHQTNPQEISKTKNVNPMPMKGTS